MGRTFDEGEVNCCSGGPDSRAQRTILLDFIHWHLSLDLLRRLVLPELHELRVPHHLVGGPLIVLWVCLFQVGVAVIVWGAESFAEHLGAASVQLGVSAFALALLLAGAEPEELAL